jgi:hypothetical protein
MNGCNEIEYSFTHWLENDDSKLQYRLQVAPHTQICSHNNVIFSNGIDQTVSISLFELFYGTCNSNDGHVEGIYLSQIINSSLSFGDDDPNDCHLVPVAFKEVTTVCPANKIHCMPLKITSLQSASYQLISYMSLKYTCDCCSLSNINEGVLVTATTVPDYLTIPLQFYATRKSNDNDTKRYITVNFTDSDNMSAVNLYYPMDVTYKSVPFHFVNDQPKDEFEKFLLFANKDKLLNRKVQFTWIQYHTGKAHDCDFWSLDNVSVTLNNGNQSRIVYSEIFDNEIQTLLHWNLTNVNFNEDVGLNFSNGTGKRLTMRRAISPVIDLEYIKPVTLSLPPPSLHGAISCNENNTINAMKIQLSFYLKFTQFIQPVPGTDTHPNAVLLSMQAESDDYKPLAYFAPVANYYWPEFTSNKLYNIPIYSAPRATQPIIVNICLTNATENLTIEWRQDNYMEGADIWSISEVSVINFDSCNQTWSSYNRGESGDSCSTCADSELSMIFNEGNGDSPRLARLTVSRECLPLVSSSEIDQIQINMCSYPIASNDISSTIAPSHTPTSMSSKSSLTTNDILSTIAPSPTPVHVASCPQDDNWPSTIVNQYANGTCRLGTVRAIRYCFGNGTWNDTNCLTSNDFKMILSLATDSPPTALNLLRKNVNIDLKQRAFLFDQIIAENLNKMASSNFTESVKKFFIAYKDEVAGSSRAIRRQVGTQLIRTMDEFALNLIPVNTTFNSSQFNFNVREVRYSNGQKFTGIQLDSNSIQLPHEIFDESVLPVKVVSAIYYNLSTLLPPDDNSFLELISAVISSITNLNRVFNLKEPVVISFDLSDQISPDNLICAFWNIKLSNNTLPSGRWSEEGCNLIHVKGTVATCHCTHLTHFAILLSPRSQSSEDDRIALTIIGQVILPISLICLLLTIFTYACMKKLWNMRNYIHVMLCINLFIAQLLFVIGVERTENEIVCSIFAIALQYMFLVTFMWMLMEGVVLYVALVTVFINHPKRYIIGFTILSYGAPALYMCGIIPLGYLVNVTDDRYNYLYFINETLTACWLSYEHGFIWTMIAPVIIIIIINFGFLIMSIVIMYTHYKKRKAEKSKLLDIKYWLKCILSLTIVMGISWIANILFFTEELIFIAYIMVIFIVCQGIIIFIMYVPLSKHVRDAYIRWWEVKKANSKIFTLSPMKSNTIPKHTPTNSVDTNGSTPHTDVVENVYENVSIETVVDSGKNSSQDDLLTLDTDIKKIT